MDYYPHLLRLRVDIYIAFKSILLLGNTVRLAARHITECLSQVVYIIYSNNSQKEVATIGSCSSYTHQHKVGKISF